MQESTHPNAGGSMIADPGIVEPKREPPGETCFFCDKLAVKKIVHLHSGDYLVFCEHHTVSSWILLEALGVQPMCEIVEL